MQQQAPTTAEAVRLTIPAKPEYITLVRLALTGLAGLRSFPDETLGDLKLAVTEAASNSVRHAYGNGDGTVEVVYELEHDRLIVEVNDNGHGFVHQQPPGSRDELDEGGLGIAIIQALADELEVGARPGGPGSRIRFVKRLTG
jgi:serine/threonine-protein kinase RsbW